MRSIKQYDSSDCGPACITYICNHYKKEILLSKIRELSKTTEKGSTMLGLVEALESLGFDVKAWRGNREVFDKPFTLPCIARVYTKEGLSHFVVITKVNKNHIYIMDPAEGKIIKKKKEDFFQDFANELLLCIPNANFIPDKEKAKSVFSRFATLILSQKKLFVLAIIGSIILTALGIISTVFNKLLMDEIIPYNLKNQLVAFCIGFGLIGLFNILLSAARQHLLLHLSLRIDIPLTLNYFNHIFNLPFSFFGSRKVGDILTRFQDVGTVKDIFSDILLSLLLDIMLTIISGIILAVINIKLFLIILAMTIVSIVLVYIFKQPYKKLNKEAMEKSSAMNSEIIDDLKGAETIKSFGVEKLTMDQIEQKYISSLKVGYRGNVLSNIQGSISSFIGNIGNLVLTGVAAYFVMDGNITLGTMMMFMQLAGYFMDPVGRLVSLQMKIQEANIALTRMSELLDLEEEQEKSKNLKKDFNIDGDISVKNVSFRYGAGRLILKDINLDIKKGETVALVGETGGGKTTLAKLILGLYTPNEGNIIINNNDLESIDKRELRNQVGYVPQNVQLFSTSVMDNIRLGKQDATLEQVQDVASKAGCSGFIDEMPTKYYTYLEEAGTNLSGGERQRLALARTLLKEPKILVLDECTSNLDFLIERKIMDTLNELKCTKIIIAHRLSTIKNADKIVVLENGSIKETGNHEELIKKNGLYKKIYDSQVG